MGNIAIIGVGALGRRHLQSLNELKGKYNIYAVETNVEAIKSLEEEFPDVSFFDKINSLPDKIEVVVIATNANVRRNVFERLIKHCVVSNIIFEKVLFQKEDDYYFVKQKLEELNIKAWVNCARREWDAYKELKKEIARCKEMYFSAIGGNWGLGCNAIHILDLIEFLTHEKVNMLDYSGLENHIVESKRTGFYEFFGTIVGTAGKCKTFSISCIENSILPLTIQLNTEKVRYIIDEVHGIMLKSDSSTNWEWKEFEFKPLYQSQMTSRVVKNIIDNGYCNLVNYENAMILHLKYITPLIKFFNNNGVEGKICPIT